DRTELRAPRTGPVPPQPDRSVSAGPPTLTHVITPQPRPTVPATEPAAQARQWFEAEPLWFKSAVFYEIHIRGFYDGNGDGSGDFRGLIEKLEYLQWLGLG